MRDVAVPGGLRERILARLQAERGDQRRRVLGWTVRALAAAALILLVIFAGNLVGRAGSTDLVVNTTGWVLVWVGIWWPLDMFFFSPLGYGRENRVLRHLRDAEVSVMTWQSHDGFTPGASSADRRPIA